MMSTDSQQLLSPSGFVLTARLREANGSELWRAVRTKDQCEVLLQFSPRSTFSATLRARYEREYEILHGSDYVGSARLLASDEGQGQPILVFADSGATSCLDTLIAEQEALPLDRCLTLAISIADALGSLHQNGVIHSALQPCQILILRAGGVELTGFHSATRLQEKQAFLDASAVSEGMPPYMSPEQSGRMNRRVDYRTDLYSLGIILYEMLTGKRPLEARDLSGWLHAHVAGSPVPIVSIAPALPDALAAIVMKLLNKQAEDRYQNAYGVKYDLEQVQHQLGNGTTEAFALGTRDHSGRLLIPDRLYGREQQAEQLNGLYSAAAGGSLQFALISGYSGIGKTALVRETHRPLTAHRGNFASGKYDQRQRNVPYSAIRAAFAELLSQIAAGDSGVAEAWRIRLRTRVGDRLRIVTDIVPELALLVGSQPLARSLPAAMAQERFQLVFQDFLAAIASESQPLVLFLDDLQWADLASLKLLEGMLATPSLGYVLVVGAYRDNEVEEGHPLLGCIKRIENAGEPVTRIHVEALKLDHVAQLLMDTTSTARDKVLPLAQIFMKKTCGNPFFVRQFLHVAHSEGLLSFDFLAGAWKWDLAAIETLEVAENVIDLMSRRLRGLPAATTDALSAAACIGHTFDLRTLALILSREPHEVQQCLWKGLESGLLLPLAGAMAWKELGHGGQALVDAHAREIRYRFLHDRVQQAAYALIGEDQRALVHYRTGRTMLESFDTEELNERLFDVVVQLNDGIACVQDDAETLQVAALNLRAAQQAHAATAYSVAVDLCHAAAKLLGSQAWDTQPVLCHSVHLLLGRSLGVVGEYAVAITILEQVLAHATSKRNRVETLATMMETFMTWSQPPRALATLLKALELFDIRVTKDTVTSLARQAAQSVEAAREGRHFDEILALPELQSDEQRSLLSLLCRGFDVIFIAGPDWSKAISAVAAATVLKYGNSEFSAPAFCMFAMSGADKQDAAGFQRMSEYSDLTLRLAGRYGVEIWIPRTYSAVGAHLHHLHKPLGDCYKLLRKASDMGWQCGDLVFAAYADYHTLLVLLVIGAGLETVATQHRECSTRVRQTKHLAARWLVCGMGQFVKALQGKTPSPASLADDGVSELAFEEATEQCGPLVAGVVNILRLQLAVLFEEPDAATRALDVLNSMSAEHAIYCSQIDTFYRLFSVFARADGFAAASGLEREVHLQACVLARDYLQALAESCPATYASASLVTRAEVVALMGEQASAGELFNQAIDAAVANEQIQFEAFANERAGRLAFAMGREGLGQYHVSRARDCYQLWGATAKVAQLNDKYGLAVGASSQLEAQPGPAGQAVAEEVPLHSSGAWLADSESLLKASRAISEEIQLEGLLPCLMEILLENAGAHFGLLVLERNGEIAIAADSVTEDAVTTQITTHHKEAVGKIEGFSPALQSVLGHVRATGESVFVNDTSCASRFGFSRIPHDRRPMSVLCLPVIKQAKRVGAIYLENNLSTHAFSSQRRSTLKALIAQAAVSLENALLYDELRREVDDRVRTELALRVERDYVSDIVAVNPAVVVCITPEGLITFVNPACEQVTEYSKEQLVGENWWQVMYPGAAFAQVDEFLRLRASSLHASDQEMTLSTRSGAERVISWNSVNHYDEAGKLVEILQFGRDITEERRAEQENARLEQQLRHAQKIETIGTLAGGIAHDFNNMLVPILGYSEILSGDLAEGSAAHQAVQQIISAAERAKDVVNRILTFSRRAEAKFQLVHPRCLIDEVTGLLQGSLPTTIEIQIDIDSACLPIPCDPTQLHQVLLNLCVNAIHAMQESGGLLTVGAHCATPDEIHSSKHPSLSAAAYTCFVVGDTGHGMDEQTRDRIFEPFFTTKGPSAGTGLGLSVVHGIVESHNGAIEVETCLGGGTQFKVYLPSDSARVDATVADGPAGRDQAAANEASLRGHERVMFVDDERPIIRMAELALARFGYQVSAFTGGIEALEALASAPVAFDVVITDQTMPGMTGTRLARAVAEIRPELPIILATGYSQSVRDQTPEQLGVGEVLQKPVSGSGYAAAIRRILPAVGRE